MSFSIATGVNCVPYAGRTALPLCLQWLSACVQARFCTKLCACMTGHCTAGTVKPHHVVTPDGVALGYSHLGMLAAARWLLSKTKATLLQALEDHPGYQLRVVGACQGFATSLSSCCFSRVLVWVDGQRSLPACVRPPLCGVCSCMPH